MNKQIIKYPKQVSEAEIQAKLWNALNQIGFDARLEVKARLNGRLHKFDIVIFKNGVPQSIIECKAYKHKYSVERLDKLRKSFQLKKYNQWGLPVFVCAYEDEISNTLELFKQSYSHHFYEEVDYAEK